MGNNICVTVTGGISPEELGVCQSHEHILLRKGKSWEVNPALWQDEPEKSLEELKAFRKAGGEAIVDAQPAGCSRMAKELKEISEGSGVKIIASTGFHKRCFYPDDHWLWKWGASELCSLFKEELQSGMYEDGDEKEPSEKTGIRTGQIKTALDKEGLTERYKRLFDAAGEAACETGAPLMIHVENGADPEELYRYLRSAGVCAGQMIFCHLDRACADIQVHKRLAAENVYLEYDTIGRPKYHSDEKEASIILEMIRSGFTDRLLLSLDTTRARLGAYGGGIDLCYLLERFVPLLKESGVTEDQIRSMLVTGPSRAFERKSF